MLAISVTPSVLSMRKPTQILNATLNLFYCISVVSFQCTRAQYPTYHMHT